MECPHVILQDGDLRVVGFLTWQLASSRVNVPKDPSGRCMAFSNLA